MRRGRTRAVEDVATVPESGDVTQRDDILTVTLVLGIVTFLFETWMGLLCLERISAGQPCSATLPALWLGIPLMVITTIAYAFELGRGRREGSRRNLSRLVGLLLALLSLPAWMMIAGLASGGFSPV